MSDLKKQKESNGRNLGNSYHVYTASAKHLLKSANICKYLGIERGLSAGACHEKFNKSNIKSDKYLRAVHISVHTRIS